MSEGELANCQANWADRPSVVCSERVSVRAACESLAHFARAGLAALASRGRQTSSSPLPTDGAAAAAAAAPKQVCTAPACCSPTALATPVPARPSACRCLPPQLQPSQLDWRQAAQTVRALPLWPLLCPSPRAILQGGSPQICHNYMYTHCHWWRPMTNGYALLTLPYASPITSLSHHRLVSCRRNKHCRHNCRRQLSKGADCQQANLHETLPRRPKRRLANPKPLVHR